MRLNLISREWVIVGSDHNRKPEDYIRRGERRYTEERVDSCPFCPGNEDKTPMEIHRIPDASQPPGNGNWKVRVVPNRFAYLSEKGERVRTNDGLHRRVTAVGKHEIIIETPRHDIPLALMDEEHLRTVLYVYRDRFFEAFKDNRIQYAIICKNHGPRSGTSIEHPHSQLIAAPVMPLQIRYRVDEAMRFFDSTGECLMCATIKDEMRDNARVIEKTDQFFSFIPYAALTPFHTWIFPLNHTQSFGNVPDEMLDDLAKNLHRTLYRMHVALGDPDYNLVVRSLSPYRSRSEYVHWYISIMPHVTQSTGFEMGTGMFVNPTLPEKAADFLRNVRVS